MIQRLLIAAALCCLAAPALAQVDTVPRVVPYDGVINLDGLAFDGLVDMRFSLFADAAGGEPIWTEDWDQANERAVEVTAGRFSVNLGAHAAIADVVSDGGALFLGIEVKALGADAWVPLAGRQRINPVPYAIWSATASDLRVTQDLTVGRDATIGQDLSAGRDILATRHVTAGENVRAEDAFRLRIDNGGWGAAMFRNDSGNLVVGEINQGFGQMNVPSTLQIGGGNNRRQLNVWHTATFNNPVTIIQPLQLQVGLRLFDDEGSTYRNALGIDGTGRIVLGEGNREAVAAGSLRVSQNAAVDGALTVSGNVSLNDCRLCLQYKTRNNNNNDNAACVRLRPGNDSGWRRFSIPNVGDNDEYRLKFLCDGGGNYTGTAL